MIYIVQILSIFFAWALAKHDAPAVQKFAEHATTARATALFHRYNNWVKFVFVISSTLVVLIKYNKVVFAVLAFVACALWIYLLFDIILNKNRPGLSWDYLGSNDADGRFWIKKFGNRAGEIKAAALLIAIICLNAYFIFILKLWN